MKELKIGAMVKNTLFNDEKRMISKTEAIKVIMLVSVTDGRETSLALS